MIKLSKLMFLLCAALTLLLPTSVMAAKPVKPLIERVVVLPLRVDDQDRYLLNSLEAALVQGLQTRYEVFFGSQVSQKAREVFDQESRTAVGECDETRCMENIAIAFQSEMIANASVTRVENGYLLALTIRNVFDNKTVFSNSLPCENCNTFELVSKLKELSHARPSANQNKGTNGAIFIQNVEVMPAESPAVSGSTASSNPEVALWNEIRNSAFIDDFNIYLGQYPKGKFSPQAKRRVKQLQELAEQQSLREEQTLWHVAEQSGAEVDYQRYLIAYPQGKYAGLAQIRLRKLAPLTVSPDEQAETAQWQAANSSASIAELQAYLDRYPAGKYVAAAKEKIKKRQKEVPAVTVSKPPVVMPSAETRSPAARLQAAEEASMAQEAEARRVIVLPPILKKFEPANKSLEWVLPYPLGRDSEHR
jgi:hypothetical protein